MNRASFLKRMAFAALASGWMDLVPCEPEILYLRPVHIGHIGNHETRKTATIATWGLDVDTIYKVSPKEIPTFSGDDLEAGVPNKAPTPEPR